MRILLCLLALVVAPWPALAEAPVEVSEFVRVDEDEKAARLQTTVTRYEKDGVVVDLLGAVHIADRGYFEELNKRFTDYEVLLFELVGGENIGGGKGSVPKKKEDAESTDFLGNMYSMFSRAMALSEQMDVIDYGAKNFVHADLTLKEFEALQDEKGESIMDFAIASAVETERSNPAASMDMGAIMSAILSGNSDGLKLALMHSMGGQDDQISKFAGESVIIADRNAKCMQVLDAELGKGRKRLGIFYGAAHFPDMEVRLRQRGFAKTKETWLTAWDVPKPSKPE